MENITYRIVCRREDDGREVTSCISFKARPKRLVESLNQHFPNRHYYIVSELPKIKNVVNANFSSRNFDDGLVQSGL